jgi:hypothetical protein
MRRWNPRDVSAEPSVESGNASQTANLNCGAIARHCCQKGADHSHRLLAEPRRRLIVARLGEEGGVGMRTVLFDRPESLGERPQRVVNLLVSVDCALSRSAASIRGIGLDSSKDQHGRWPPRWRENGVWWARVSSDFLGAGSPE